MFKFLFRCVLIVLIVLTGHVAYFIFDGLTDELGRAEAIVVLGNEVLPSGEPSARLKSRLDRGYDLYRDGYSEQIVVSGGPGKSGFEEALVMKEYLVGRGVPAEAIKTDLLGVNTFHTAKFVKKNRIEPVLVVSQYYHITRCKLAFKKMGVSEVYSAHANMLPEWRDFYSVPREIVAFYSYLTRRYPRLV